MKIAIVYDAVYPYVKGGAERRYYELARRLARRGHDVHWYGMRYWDGPRVVKLHGVTYHGICRPLPLYTDGGRRSILQAVLFGLACLRLAGRRFDVIDCCGFPYFSLFSVRLAIALRGGRLVSTWHEVWGAVYWASYLGRLGFAGTAVERLAARVPHTIVSVSGATSARLASELGREEGLEMVPNGVDFELIDGSASSGDSRDIIYAGRLCDFKHVELLIGALPEVLLQRPGTACTIIGDGPHRLKLEEFVREVGVEKAVTFVGFVEDQEAFYGLLKSSRVLVLPSRREGFGMVVLEANAAGLPVLVADHPENFARDLIGDDNGEVIAAESPAFSAAIVRLLAEAPGMRGDACRAAARRHDWDCLTVRYEQILAVTPGKALA